jgi:hypothetical protein
VRFFTAILVVLFFSGGFIQSADAEKLLNGYVSASNGPVTPGIEPEELMADPTVDAKTATQQAATSATAHSKFRIAIVPHDYKDQYQVGAFDSRLGEASCSMKGVYARCVYKRSEYY